MLFWKKFTRMYCCKLPGNVLTAEIAIANRVIFLDGGKIVEEAAPAEFFDRPKTERAQRFLRTFTFDAVK